MTSRVATVEPDEDVDEAVRIMFYLDVHRLFVVEHGELVGVLSQSDIVRALATAKI